MSEPLTELAIELAKIRQMAASELSRQFGVPAELLGEPNGASYASTQTALPGANAGTTDPTTHE